MPERVSFIPFDEEADYAETAYFSTYLDTLPSPGTLVHNSSDPGRWRGGQFFIVRYLYLCVDAEAEWLLDIALKNKEPQVQSGGSYQCYIEPIELEDYYRLVGKGEPNAKQPAS